MKNIVIIPLLITAVAAAFVLSYPFNLIQAIFASMSLGVKAGMWVVEQYGYSEIRSEKIAMQNIMRWLNEGATISATKPGEASYEGGVIKGLHIDCKNAIIPFKIP